MSPQSQLKDIHTPAAAFAATDQILADPQSLSKLALTQSSARPEGLQLFQKESVLLGV